ncbi:hypothetical protein S7711_10403 [Stachybotrys chartarum IBT 7711]|uniref:Uncharacterized protein n=1 Tax=Stachybotrys chartarum (strain CBS 109288 / IBT 7711) TaxID=1280523 RepID=A0A084B442_STACB|nr:hypothetical protein S7711_10403 [Stachybotrys chartarum IBT 7711]
MAGARGNVRPWKGGLLQGSSRKRSYRTSAGRQQTFLLSPFGRIGQRVPLTRQYCAHLASSHLARLKQITIEEGSILPSFPFPPSSDSVGRSEWTESKGQSVHGARAPGKRKSQPAQGQGHGRDSNGKAKKTLARGLPSHATRTSSHRLQIVLLPRSIAMRAPGTSEHPVLTEPCEAHVASSLGSPPSSIIVRERPGGWLPIPHRRSGPNRPIVQPQSAQGREEARQP